MPYPLASGLALQDLGVPCWNTANNKDESMFTTSSSQPRRKSEYRGEQMDLDILGMGHRPIFLVSESSLEKVLTEHAEYRNQKGCIRGILGIAGSQQQPPGRRFCST